MTFTVQYTPVWYSRYDKDLSTRFNSIIKSKHSYLVSVTKNFDFFNNTLPKQFYLLHCYQIFCTKTQKLRLRENNSVKN